MLLHVLEHLEDVEVCLEQIKAVLSSQGKLIIAVPNKASLQARFGKEDWYHLDPPRHLHHFTPPALKGVLRAHGYHIDGEYQDSFFMNFTGDIVTILNRLSPRKNALINLLKKNKHFYAEGISGALLSIIWNILLMPFLVLPTLIVTGVSQLMQSAGTMIVIANRSE
jgi:hypothetical protein